jgi:hypothetical protein
MVMAGLLRTDVGHGYDAREDAVWFMTLIREAVRIDFGPFYLPNA